MKQSLTEFKGSVNALVPHACFPEQSKGRLVAESESTTRNCFQRDRDRIIHSTAFRRLEYKTQVFVNHEGDHYRTRLTHTLEVSQIARTLARCLGLNEDLAEAVALAHDLGHPPFGHGGETALNYAMANFGGFEGNGQTFRILTKLESHTAEHGLDLTRRTLLGVLKYPVPFSKLCRTTIPEADVKSEKLNFQQKNQKNLNHRLIVLVQVM